MLLILGTDALSWRFLDLCNDVYIEKMCKPEAQHQVSKNITHCSIRQHFLRDKKEMFPKLACKCLLWSLASKLLCEQVILH